MKNKKLICIVITFILILSVGYAILSANLNINGVFNFQEASWDVYLDNIQVTKGSVEADLPVISDKTTINFESELSKPGEFYEFSVDVVNAGTIDAVINNIEKTSLSEEQAKYINYIVRYYGTNNSVSSNYVIPAGYKERVIVRMEYKYDIENVINFNNLSLSLSLTIKQPEPSKEYKNIVYNFFPIEAEETFIATKSGTYRLETWGEQGGDFSYAGRNSCGGYGGYSIGYITLNKKDSLYISVGKMFSGESGYSISGFNGGGSGERYGGSATHIAKVSGQLKSLNNSVENILIVSGGGGGADYYGIIGGSGGGYIGGDANSERPGKGGTQSSGGSGHSSGGFGYGGNALDFTEKEGIDFGGGGGGGYYGGGAANRWAGSGGGGSGYIGNSLLTNKEMYCYNCEESAEEATKTISTTNVSEEPISKFAKKGYGFARITYIG